MQPIRLAVDGAGVTFAQAPASVAQLCSLLAVPDSSAGVNVSVYASETAPTDGTVPANAVPLAQLVSPAGGPSVSLPLGADGVPFGGFLVAEFADGGAQHCVYLYCK